jgi:hypothetical protein
VSVYFSFGCARTNVKVEGIGGGSLGHDAKTHANLLLRLCLALLEVREVADIVGELVIVVELVRVWVGLFGGSERVDLLGANLKVLLEHVNNVKCEQGGYFATRTLGFSSSVSSFLPSFLGRAGNAASFSFFFSSFSRCFWRRLSSLLEIFSPVTGSVCRFSALSPAGVAAGGCWSAMTANQLLCTCGDIVMCDVGGGCDGDL